MSTTAKFPSDFYWGYATASAQVEGSVSHSVGLVPIDSQELTSQQTDVCADICGWKEPEHLGYFLCRPHT